MLGYDHTNFMTRYSKSGNLRVKLGSSRDSGPLDQAESSNA